MAMNSICFFASYFSGKHLPYYIKVYLKELKRHFTEVVLLIEEKQLSPESLEFLTLEHIRIQQEKNSGFDFGLWYKAFQKTSVLSYDRVALVNDSCILFKPLDELMSWAAEDTAELKGITKSEAVSPHVQSYFLLIHKSAIPATLRYFEKHKVYSDIEAVITHYEIGLSKYLLSQGYTLSAFIDNNGYSGEFSPYYQCVDYHIQKGIPVIKKKILYSSYRKRELATLARMNFNINPLYYIDMIKKAVKNPLVDFEKILMEKQGAMNLFQRLKYTFRRHLITLARPLYKMIKQ